MTEVWDQARVEQYITQGIEESLTLDYKAAGSLAKTDEKRTEITKDVSAMANSAGGILIYGVAEHKTQARKHLPEKIDPIDRTQISKEWLEHIISNIRPKIDGIAIYPVPINTAVNHAVYVVVISQSSTAHQAGDKRYYKRFNFESVAMDDYELRDVMGRRQHARIELKFGILIYIKVVNSGGIVPGYDYSGRKQELETQTVHELKVKMVNVGKVYAQYVEGFIEMPCGLIPDREARLREYLRKPPLPVDLDHFCTYKRDNTVRDLIKGGYGSLGPPAEYGPARHVPILPGITRNVDDFELTKDFEEIDWGTLSIKWTTHVDNAPPVTGEIAIKDIEIVDRRKNSSDDVEDNEQTE